MSAKRSRWDDDDEDEQDQESIKKTKEREAKKNAKLAKKLQETKSQQGEQSTSVHKPLVTGNNSEIASAASEPPSRSFTPSKRRRVSPSEPPPQIFPLESPEITGCRSVDIYEKLNHIEEGSYGIVYRAKDKETGDIVALKKLKLDREKNGFPITSLREISTLMAARHPNIVNIRKVVMGDSLLQYYLLA
jgi:cell division cycle 2-like